MELAKLIPIFTYIEQKTKNNQGIRMSRSNSSQQTPERAVKTVWYLYKMDK